MLYVDDGSTDGSGEVLLGLAREDPAVRVLRQRRNSGQSAALGAGFRFARGAIVVTLDADLQNDPADIPRLLALMDRYDVVSGVRTNRRDTWVRQASSRSPTGCATGSPTTTSPMSAAPCAPAAPSTCARVPLFTGMHRFLPTLLKMAGARATEIPVNHRPRLHGQPKYNISNRLWRALADLFAVRWMQKRWIDPNLSEEIEVWTTNSSGTSGPP